MKIKKATQVIILVVALVSVIGVGAVSYAAWTGSNGTLLASAQIGSVSVVGFENNTALKVEKLVPIDQDADSAHLDGAMFRSVALPKASVTGNYKITVKGAASAVDIRVNIGAEISAKPSYTTNDQGITVENFVSIANGATYVFNGEVSGEAENNLYTVEGLYLNVVLVSNDVADMNQTIEGISIVIEAA